MITTVPPVVVTILTIPPDMVTIMTVPPGTVAMPTITPGGALVMITVTPGYMLLNQIISLNFNFFLQLNFGYRIFLNSKIDFVNILTTYIIIQFKINSLKLYLCL